VARRRVLAGTHVSNWDEFIEEGGGSSGQFERGIATFTSGGSNTSAVILAIPFPDVNYTIGLAVGVTDPMTLGPGAQYTSKTVNGFTIIVDAAFDGEVSWTASES
jgi:hypothetical protein